MNTKQLAATIVAGTALGAVANAADVPVNADITTSQTWTANNVYILEGQRYVRNMASLTIEPGTLVIGKLGASLAVTNGSQIFANGTAAAPIVMTSEADRASWTDPNDPTSGAKWRETANEWGNLTIMGDAYISEDAVGTNTQNPNPGNVANMEGLVLAGGQDPQDNQYGGGDDDYDAGNLTYLNLRYGGRVIGLNNELNGLSLGGLGRGTEVEFVEIMNNVDDGIEVWGGTVNFKNISIWNVGDDSFDIDQGWRGQAQFGLIVQGFSLDASQGSGVGDNAIEHDGAEDSDAQPVTTAQIYNFTVIGQPVDGDGLTAWRDGARVQYRNCIFMDGGEKVVRDDGDDGDGANGYGFNGSLPFIDDGNGFDPNSNGVDDPDVWDTADTFISPVNGVDGSSGITAAQLYQAQSGGTLAEISDSVFFRNSNSSAYPVAVAAGVIENSTPGNKINNNVLRDFTGPSPIANILRHSAETKGGKVMLRVVKLDPRAAGDAVTSATGGATPGAFYDAADYRGAFDSSTNWLEGWSSSDAFGFFDFDIASSSQINSGNNVADNMDLSAPPALGTTVSFTFDPTGSCGIAAGSPYVTYLGLPTFAPVPFGFFASCGAGNNGALFILPSPAFQIGAGAYVGAPGSLTVPLPFAGELGGQTLAVQNIYINIANFSAYAGGGVNFTFGI